jgi:hypothetical protein
MLKVGPELKESLQKGAWIFFLILGSSNHGDFVADIFERRYQEA